jgi:hypothetical protein
MTVVPVAPPQPVKVGAPPEPVALEPAAVKDAFAAGGNARFLDLSGRFTLDDRAKIQKAAEDLAFKTGGKVWLLAIPGKTDVANFASVHKDLHLGPRDVYFIFNGDKRHLQTASKTMGNEVLKTTNKAFYKSQVQGTVDMMDELGKALTSANAASSTATTAVPVKAPRASKTGGAEILLVAVALAVVAWLVIKRKPTPKPAVPSPEPSSRESHEKDDGKSEGA